MADSEDNVQSSKKRTAGRQLSRDNADLDDEETPGEEMGTFKKASDEVIASRKIVKVRRNTTTPSSNPFAGIQLVPPANIQATPNVGSAETIPEKVEEKSSADQETEANDKHPGGDVPEGKPESNAEKDKIDNADESDKTKLVDEKITEGIQADGEGKEDITANNGEGEAGTDADEAKKDVESESGELKANKDANDAKTETQETNGGENVEKSVEASPFSSFQQLSSNQNAFTGVEGTGFSSSTFSFGSFAKNDSGSSSSSPFSFAIPGNVSSSLFGHPGVPIVGKSEGTKFPSMPEVPTETGEENESAVFTSDSMLFEFLDGSWKERGKGELKVNVSTTETGKARLVMRTKGNYRLILNASLYPDMKLTNMEKKGITFACVNSASEGKDGLSTYAAKFKDASIVEEFRAAVTDHKGKAAASSLRTPENSPKASDD